MIGNTSAEHRAMDVVNYVGFKPERLTINIDSGLTCVILGTECSLSEPWVFFFFFFSTYLLLFVAVSGLSCGLWDLHCGMWTFL